MRGTRGRRRPSVLGLVALTSAAVRQQESPDRLARTDAALARLEGGTAGRDDALTVLSAYWTAEGGRRQPSFRTVAVGYLVLVVATLVACQVVVRTLGLPGLLWLVAALVVLGLVARAVRAVLRHRRHRRWYGTTGRRAAVRSSVGVALDRLGVWRDGWELPREAQERDRAAPPVGADDHPPSPPHHR